MSVSEEEVFPKVSLMLVGESRQYAIEPPFDADEDGRPVESVLIVENPDVIAVDVAQRPNVGVMRALAPGWGGFKLQFRHRDGRPIESHGVLVEVLASKPYRLPTKKAKEVLIEKGKETGDSRRKARREKNS